EGGKDRVLQLREHKPDEPRTRPPQAGRTLVTEDVERRKDELLRRLCHPGPLIERAAHGRFAHSRVLSHFGKPPPHRRQASARNRQPAKTRPPLARDVGRGAGLAALSSWIAPLAT